MTPKERVKHILSVTKDKERIYEWLHKQIGKKVHPMLNENNLTQEQIDSYWHEVIKEMNHEINRLGI